MLLGLGPETAYMISRYCSINWNSIDAHILEIVLRLDFHLVPFNTAKTVHIFFSQRYGHPLQEIRTSSFNKGVAELVKYDILGKFLKILPDSVWRSLMSYSSCLAEAIDSYPFFLQVNSAPASLFFSNCCIVQLRVPYRISHPFLSNF